MGRRGLAEEKVSELVGRFIEEAESDDCSYMVRISTGGLGEYAGHIVEVDRFNEVVRVDEGNVVRGCPMREIRGWAWS